MIPILYQAVKIFNLQYEYDVHHSSLLYYFLFIMIHDRHPSGDTGLKKANEEAFYRLQCSVLIEPDRSIVNVTKPCSASTQKTSTVQVLEHKILHCSPVLPLQQCFCTVLRFSSKTIFWRHTFVSHLSWLLFVDWQLLQHFLSPSIHIPTTSSY